MMMNSTILNNLVMFAIGAAVGSVVTWRILKPKYEKIAREGVESVKEYYGITFGDRKEETDICEEPDQNVERENLDELAERTNRAEVVKNYHEILKKSGYINYSGNENIKSSKEVNDVERPYVIEPEQFGEIDGYSQVFMSYYADGKLVDDGTNEIVEDIDVTVGDFEEHIGDYEDDLVHVRNDAFRCDYEITRVNEKYYDED